MIDFYSNYDGYWFGQAIHALNCNEFRSAHEHFERCLNARVKFGWGTSDRIRKTLCQMIDTRCLYNGYKKAIALLEFVRRHFSRPEDERLIAEAIRFIEENSNEYWYKIEFTMRSEFDQKTLKIAWGQQQNISDLQRRADSLIYRLETPNSPEVEELVNRGEVAILPLVNRLASSKPELVHTTLFRMGSRAIIPLIEAIRYWTPFNIDKFYPNEYRNMENDDNFSGVCRILAHLARQGEVIPLLLCVLNDPNPYIQIATMGALGDRKVTEAVSLLLPLSQHSDARVRGAVAHTLGEIGDARALPELRRMQQDHTDIRFTTVAARAYEAIQQIESQRRGH